MSNLKYGTNEPIYKTEIRLTDIEIQTYGCKGREGMEGVEWEFGIHRCKLLHLEWINEVLLCIPQRTVSSILG